MSRGALIATVAAAFALFISPTLAQDEIGCFEPGVCDGGSVIDVTVQDDQMECLEKCKETLGCQYFTYYKSSSACFNFLTCPSGLDFSTCGNDCVSGNVNCEEYICDVIGLCQGHVIRFERDENHDQCKANCYAEPECTWYGYHTDTVDCLLLSECIHIQETYQFARTGQKECYELAETKDYTKLFAAGGCDTQGCTDETELLDISDGTAVLTCPDLPGFPYEVSFALAARANDYPMVCGGQGVGSNAQPGDPEKVLSECHRFYNGSWSYLGEMIEPRYGAAGLQLPNGTVWITGGQRSVGTNEVMSATETINLSGVSSVGPSLPIPLVHHCVVRLGEFMFGLIGGADVQGAPSSSFWVLDKRDDSWTKMADLATGRYGHVCETVFSDTRGTEVVVAGGTVTGTNPLASTEIFSLNSQVWRAGPDLPEGLQFASSVQKGNTLVTVGGQDADLDSQVGTYHYDVEAQTWSDSPEERLSSKRYGVAAVAVDTGLAGCTYEN